MSWTIKTDIQISGYEILRRRIFDGGSEAAQIVSTVLEVSTPGAITNMATRISFPDTTSTYYYWVRSYCFDHQGNKYYSNYSNMITTTPMSYLVGFSWESEDSESIDISFSNVLNADGIQLTRISKRIGTSVSSTSKIVYIEAEGTAIDYHDEGLSLDYLYTYEARAYSRYNGSRIYSPKSVIFTDLYTTLPSISHFNSDTELMKNTLSFRGTNKADGYRITYVLLDRITGDLQRKTEYVGTEQGLNLTYEQNLGSPWGASSHYTICSYRLINDVKCYSKPYVTTVTNDLIGIPGLNYHQNSGSQTVHVAASRELCKWYNLHKRKKERHPCHR